MSIDGLQPEHDERRTPATYERILKHIDGHQITVHCTVTRQQVRREGYLEEFLRTWQANPNTRLIWMSLYTPQKGEMSAERLTKADRERVIADLRRLRPVFSKLQLPGRLAQRVRRPAEVSDGMHLRADDRVLLGGSRTAHHAVPVRRRSRLPQLWVYGVGRLGSHRSPRLKGGIPVGRIFYASLHVGNAAARIRSAISSGGPVTLPPAGDRA